MNWREVLAWHEHGRDILFLVIGGVSLLLSLLGVQPFGWDMAWTAILLCGVPIVLGAVQGLVTAFDIKADVLVSLALIASVAIGEIFAAGEVAFIMQLGALLEELTVLRARAGIASLVQMTPRMARRVQNKQEELVPAEVVRAGDILRVLPGETIPVDGVITAGSTAVNQAAITGESLPVDKGVGEEVLSGGVNQFGAFTMRAEKAGEDSSIQRMIRLVQSADASKAKIVGMADRWATWVVVIALAAAWGTYLVTGEILRAVTILVVFCPCALVLATPAAVMAAIGNATKHGFLVREGDALERLAQVSRVAFDKTGTLTEGKLRVTAVKSLGTLPEEELFRYGAAVEQSSEHPLGKAVVNSFRERELGALPQAEDFVMVPGRGAAAVVEGKTILAGNLLYLQERQIRETEKLSALAKPCLQKGCTVIYLAAAGRAAGIIALTDTLRQESAAVIADLQETQIQAVLLTGDQPAAARQVAASTGVQDVQAGLLPEDKLSYIRQKQAAKEPVCMIGDGINDAPALKTAQVGIAMGGVGSDVAVEAADIVLINDDLRELPHLMRLARQMMRTIRKNLVFAMSLNFVAILLAMTGVLNPVVGALVHNAGSVLVIVNSAFLLGWERYAEL